jgi:hypothetical protein
LIGTGPEETLVASKDTAITRTDQIGKVFQVIGPDARKCLICEALFSRHAAAEHARVVCGVRRTQLQTASQCRARVHQRAAPMRRCKAQEEGRKSNPKLVRRHRSLVYGQRSLGAGDCAQTHAVHLAKLSAVSFRRTVGERTERILQGEIGRRPRRHRQ